MKLMMGRAERASCSSHSKDGDLLEVEGDLYQQRSQFKLSEMKN